MITKIRAKEKYQSIDNTLDCLPKDIDILLLDNKMLFHCIEPKIDEPAANSSTQFQHIVFRSGN